MTLPKERIEEILTDHIPTTSCQYESAVEAINQALKEADTKGDHDLQHELEGLLNSCCMENGSDTPDSILALYMLDCLSAFDKAVRLREAWYGRKTSQPTEEEGIKQLEPTDE